MTTEAAPQRRVLAATVSAVILVLFIAIAFVLRIVELRTIAGREAAKKAEKTVHQQEVMNDIARANGLWNSGKKTEAIIKYKELMRERHTLEDKSPFSMVYGRVIELEADEGDTVAASSMIREALESSISLTLSSTKANVILRRVHGELEAEEREFERRAEEDRRKEQATEPALPQGESKHERSKSEVEGRDYYSPNEDVGLGSRAMTVERDGKQVLVRRKVPPEHIGLGVTVEGYDAIANDMTEEEVRSILKSSGRVGTVDESHKFVTYNKNWSGTKYIEVIYRPGYKAWVVEEKNRFGF